MLNLALSPKARPSVRAVAHGVSHTSAAKNGGHSVPTV